MLILYFTKVGRKVVIEELSEIDVLIKTGIPRSHSASGTRVHLLICTVESTRYQNSVKCSYNKCKSTFIMYNNGV